MQFTDPLSLFFFVIGLVCGSFANVLICRLPCGKKVTGRSQCPHCKKKLAALDLIPVLSFIFLRGRCRFCGERISIQYPLVELGSGLLFMVALFLVPGDINIAFLLSIALWLLFVIAIIDAFTQGIPDVLNIPFLVIAAVLAWLIGSINWIAPTVAGGFFLVQWVISSRRWVGSGDIILAAGIGFLLGDWVRVIFMLGVSYILGAAVASVLLLTKKKTKKDPLAFGPFLAAGALITLLWGDTALYLLLI